jgi:hypothetical protein
MELDDKSQDIITFLKRVWDTNIVRRFLDAKYDEVNRDTRFDARKRLQLKQIIWIIKNEFISNQPQIQYQWNIVESKEALPNSVTMKLVWGEMERNILWRGRKKLALKSASNWIAVLNKWETVDNILKFTENTWSILKWGETVETSFLYDNESGCVKVYAKDGYTGEQRLLDTVYLTWRKRNSSKVINLPQWWYFAIDFRW